MMGASLVKINTSPANRNYREFIVDTVNDLHKLPTSTKEGKLADEVSRQPCAPGSIATVCDGTIKPRVYILTPSDIWTLYKGNG